ncbi:hypothetical protein D3C72_368570 [compost metagenome]
MDLENKLFHHLRACQASGKASFESLIRILMESISERSLSLSRAGSQHGRDMRTSPGPGTVIHLECKRYEADRGVRTREVLGELQEALLDCPNLDGWILVATTEVSDQTRTSLEKAAHDRGITILVIDTGGHLPLLAVLCAASSEIVTKFLRDHIKLSQYQLNEVMSILTSVRNHPAYREHLSSLVGMLNSEELGLANWQHQQNDWLLKTLSKPASSRAAFFQDIAVRSVSLNVPRTKIFLALDQWLANWSIHRQIAVALGEEGDGKSWSLATWASNRIADGNPCPAFLFVPARNIDSTDPIDIISKATCKHFGQRSAPFWEGRIRRWVGTPSEEGPRIVLILDGINEQASFRWRELLEVLSAEPFRESVAVILTCRKAFWNRTLQGRAQVPIHHIEVPHFDDRELEEALAYYSLTKADFLPQIHDLLHRPRYLDLVVRHGKAAGKYDDFTLDRLIVEEWKDRLKRGHPSEFCDDELQALIQELARKSLDGASSFMPNVVGNHLGIVNDPKQALEDLISHGILEPDPYKIGKLRIERKRMVFGLGLALAEDLRETSDSLPVLQERINSLLEPHSDMDIKGAICGSAVFHALHNSGYPQTAQLALISAWLGNHNQQDTVAQCLPAYFLSAPDTYLDLAEQVWGLREIDDFAERVLFHTFVEHANNAQAIEAFIHRFEQWLGLASIDGPERYRRDPEKLAAFAARLSENLGTTPETGVIDYHGFPIRLTSNEPVLRLGRMALAVISAGPRKPYLHAIAIGLLAEALTEEPFKYDLFAWTLRMASDDIRRGVESEVLHLIKIGDRPGLVAAARYLSLASLPELECLRVHIPENLFPIPDWVREWEADPLRYENPWKHKHRYFLSMPGLSGPYLAERARELALDPQNLDQPGLRSALEGVLDDLDPSDMWTGMFPTTTEYHFDSRANALAAWAPDIAVDFLRRVAREVGNRSGLALRQLALHASEIGPILESDERQLFEKVWESLIQRQTSWSDNEEVAECWLFPLILEGKSWQAQFEVFLRRPLDAGLPRMLWYDLEEVPREEMLSFLDFAETRGRLALALDYLAHHRGPLPSQLAPRLMALLQFGESDIRTRVIRLLCDIEPHASLESFVQGQWSFRDCKNNSQEPIWGSITLVRHGSSLPLEELVQRVHPCMLGDAIVARGSKFGELQVFSEVIDRCLGSHVSVDPTEVEIFVSPGQGPELAGLPGGWGKRQQRIVSGRSHWGGTPPLSAQEVGDLFQPLDDDEIERAMKRVREALGSAWSHGSYLAFRLPGIGPLEVLVEALPSKVNEWIRQAAQPQARRKGMGFFVALSWVLFKLGDSRAASLFQLLWKESIGFTIEQYNLPMLLFCAFSGNHTAEAERHWDRIVDECQSDKALIQTIVIARMKQRNAWLETCIKNRLESPTVDNRARAIACLGLVSMESRMKVLSETKVAPDTWLSEIAEWGEYLSKREEWSRHWFQNFLTTPSAVEAWGAWRLFLQTVDSRFWIDWKHFLESEGAFASRVRQTYRCLSDVKKAIEKNEDRMKETLFGTKIMKGEVWPWL